MSDSLDGGGTTGMPFPAALLHPTASELMLEKRKVLNALTMLQFRALAVSLDLGILKGRVARAIDHLDQFDATQRPFEDIRIICWAFGIWMRP